MLTGAVRLIFRRRIVDLDPNSDESCMKLLGMILVIGLLGLVLGCSTPAPRQPSTSRAPAGPPLRLQSLGLDVNRTAARCQYKSLIFTKSLEVTWMLGGRRELRADGEVEVASCAEIETGLVCNASEGAELLAIDLRDLVALPRAGLPQPPAPGWPPIVGAAYFASHASVKGKDGQCVLVVP